MSDRRAPAPGALAVVQAFVNTVDIESDTDQLADPEALVAWLRDRALVEVDGAELRCTRRDLERAIAVREALREVMLRHNGDGPDEGDPHPVLDDAAERARFTMRFTPDATIALVPRAGGVDGALGRLLAIVHAAEADGTWRRMKACRADTCRWAFYDHSRNGSGTWCQMSVCGSREKMRAYRRRKSDPPR